MSSMALRLQKHLEVETTMGAVATLRQLADEAGLPIRGERRNVVIPANANGPARIVHVNPGRWLIEATLPSGETITEEVAVPAGENVPVTFHSAEHSPDPWLAWQHLIGNIEGAETLKLMQEAARAIVLQVAQEALKKHADGKLVSRLVALAVSAADYVFRKVGAALPGLLERVAPRVANVAGLVADGDITGRAVPAAASARSSPGTAAKTEASQRGEPVVRISQVASVMSDNSAAWTRVLTADLPFFATCPPSEGSTDIETWVYRFDGPSQLAMRHVAHVAWANERYAISLPLPWPNLEQEKPVPAEVMVRMHPLQQRVQIGVAVLDEAFGALSGLMTASTLPKAAIAVEQAEDMLYWKGKNPLAAAAGGYVLLAAGDPKQTRWHQWIENLEARFPDLPDGAVLKGCLRLRYPRDTNSPDEALAAFIRAFDRGIPFFSAGVAWLLDGLTLFADDEATDERSVQLQSKLMQVQRIAQRLDLSQAFTVVRLSDRIAS